MKKVLGIPGLIVPASVKISQAEPWLPGKMRKPVAGFHRQGPGLMFQRGIPSPYSPLITSPEQEVHNPGAGLSGVKQVSSEHIYLAVRQSVLLGIIERGGIFEFSTVVVVVIKELGIGSRQPGVGILKTQDHGGQGDIIGRLALAVEVVSFQVKTTRSGMKVREG